MALLRRWFGGEGPGHYERGMRHYNEGDWNQALECFSSALTDLPDDSHPYHALSRFYTAEIHARLGGRLLAEGEDASALVHLEAALEEQPEYPDLHFRKGVAMLRSGDAHGAEESARSAIQRNRDYSEAWLLKALSARELGNEVAASEAFERARQIAAQRETPIAKLFQEMSEPGTPQLYAYLFEGEERRRRIERAEGLFQQGFWPEAGAILSSLIEENPAFADLRLKLAVVHFQLQENGEALRQLDAALAQNPQFEDAHALAGAVRLRLGETAAARNHYVAASDAEGARSFISYGRAISELLLGDEVACQSALRPLLREEHPPTQARAIAAALLALQGEWTAARGAWDDLINQGSPEDVIEDAVCAALQYGMLEDADRWARHLPAGAPNPGIALLRSELLSRRGRPEAAVDVLDAALGIHPRNAALLLASATVLASDGDPEAALRRVESILALQPELPGSRALKGRILLEMGNAEESVATLGEERELPGASLECELNLLSALRLAGQNQAAQEHYRQLQLREPISLRLRLQEGVRWLAPLLGLPGVGRDVTA